MSPVYPVEELIGPVPAVDLRPDSEYIPSIVVSGDGPRFLLTGYARRSLQLLSRAALQCSNILHGTWHRLTPFGWVLCS